MSEQEHVTEPHPRATEGVYLCTLTACHT